MNDLIELEKREECVCMGEKKRILSEVDIMYTYVKDSVKNSSGSIRL